jgi:hypothetical protein
VVNHLETIAPLGIDALNLDLELYTADYDEAYAEKLFAANGLVGKKVIALNPGASHPVNRWHTRCFASLTTGKELSAKVSYRGGDLELAPGDGCRRDQPLVLTGTTDLAVGGDFA